MLHAFNALAPRHNQGYEVSRESSRQQVRVGDDLALKARSKRISLRSEGAGAVEESHQSRGFEKAAKHLVKRALRAVKHDLGAMFQSFGLDRKAGKALAKSLIQPVKDALRSGADFTAQIKMMALSQETKVSGGEMSQKLFMVAKSIDIEVNHSTGEVSVETASLKLQQSLTADFQPIQVGGFELPALDDILPDAVKDLLGVGDEEAGETPAAASKDEQLVQKLAEDVSEARADGDDDGDDDDDDGAVQRAEGREGLGAVRDRDDVEIDDDGDGDDDGDRAASKVEPAGTPVALDEPKPAEEPAADDGAAEGTEVVALDREQTRIRVRAVQRISNELGEFVTRIRLDAAIDLTRFAAGDENVLQSARVEARGSFLSLRA